MSATAKTSKTKTKSTTKSKAKGNTTTKTDKAAAKRIKKLEQDIADLEVALLDATGKQAEAEDRMKRVVAEYENAKKRREREADRALTYARDRLLAELFPLVDNLRRSARYEDAHKDDDSHTEGMRIIFEQMKKYLKETAGVEAFEPLNEVFDPEMHEAMAMRAEEEVESGIVIEVFECGYRSGDRILRPAKVVVSE